MLITWQEYKKDKSIPHARIQVEIPRRVDELHQTPNMYWQDVSSVPQVKMDQTLPLRVSVIPSDERIFDMKPKLFLFRYVNRPWKKDFKFRKSWKHLVHPTDTTIFRNHRYWWWSHSNPYGILDRVTEFDLNINTNTITWKKEFYWWSDASPDWTVIKFRPLAWFTNSQDISNNWITFPQPMFQDVPWLFDAWVWIEPMFVQSWAWNPMFQYRYSWRWRPYKWSKVFHFWVMLMVQNPDYDWTTQTPEYVSASNMSEFTLTYKNAILIDGTNWIFWKYAIDWRVLPK